MQVDAKEYRRRLNTFSKPTMQLIGKTMTSKLMVRVIYLIVMDSQTEQEVVDKITFINSK